jgi:hypothetical protein
MKIVFAIIAVVVLLILATLLKNHAPLFDTPGPLKRLAVYFTTNTASTSDNHPFPELRTPVYTVGAAELYRDVKDAAISLGWSIIDSNDVEWRLDMVAKTHFLLFMDDVKVEIEPLDTPGLYALTVLTDVALILQRSLVPAFLPFLRKRQVFAVFIDSQSADNHGRAQPDTITDDFVIE